MPEVGQADYLIHSCNCSKDKRWTNICLGELYKFPIKTARAFGKMRVMRRTGESYSFCYKLHTVTSKV